VRCVLAFLAFACFVPAKACAQVMSVEELNDRVEQWRAAKKAPPASRYHVEGRATFLDRRHISFKNCRISFESASDLPEPTRRGSNLEAAGTIVRDERRGAYRFLVDSVRELPSDVETFLDRRRLLRDQPAEKLFDLADWARRRGEFYKDAELSTFSDEATVQALELERRQLPRGDWQGLLALADKAGRLKVPAKAAEELVHEGISILWRDTRGRTGVSLQELLKLIEVRLVGATEQSRNFDSAVQSTYFSAPDDTYRAADQEKRKRLNRMLYADVLLRTITPELAPDGSNGFEVAEKIDRLIPEQSALAESYRDRALATRSKEVDRLERPDLIETAKKYRDRGQARQAEQLIETWLTLRRRVLDPDDTEGLIQLTRDYRTLLNRNDLADKLLKEAWQRNPKATDIAERLQQAGYRLFDGAWMTIAEYNARPEGQLARKIRAGDIVKGMTGSDVRRSLGEPQRIARAATADQITEIWSYGQSDTTRLTVLLKRAKRQPDLSVVEVTQSAMQ
jgi:hypothetical protein